MKYPLVSVLIPAYNAERWIPDTLISVLEQTWPNIEIIVVDDGSTDNTVRAVRSLQISHLRLIETPNNGAAAARNTAFENSSGEFIQWLDADDLLHSQKIAKQMEAQGSVLDRDKVYSSEWAYFFYRPNAAEFAPSSLWESLEPAEWFRRKFTNNLYMQTATWLVSRRLTEAAGPWNTRLLSDDDGEYFGRVVRFSTGTVFVKDSKVYYRRTPANRLGTIGRDKSKQDAQVLSMRLQIGYFKELANDTQTGDAVLAYLRTWLLNFYPNRPDLVSALDDIANQFGGYLPPPQLRRKYAWIRPLFGWDAAKRAQHLFPEIRNLLLRIADSQRLRLDRIFRRTHTLTCSPEPWPNFAQDPCPGDRGSDPYINAHTPPRDSIRSGASRDVLSPD